MTQHMEGISDRVQIMVRPGAARRLRHHNDEQNSIDDRKRGKQRIAEQKPKLKKTVPPPFMHGDPSATGSDTHPPGSDPRETPLQPEPLGR